MFCFFNQVKSIRREYGNDIPSWLKLTTITMTSSFNAQIDIDCIKQYFEKNETIKIRPKKSKYSFIFHKSPTDFFNQVSIYTDDYKSRKSVKLFPNGSIHVSGCGDMMDCERILAQINCVVSSILKKKVIANDFSVHMINSNFSLNKFVNLHTIFKEFGERGHDTTFNPDRYSAVKIKMMVATSASGTNSRRVTVSIFSSGKIIVTGGKALSDIIFAYKTIIEIIYKQSHGIIVGDVQQHDTFDTWRGFKIEKMLEKYNSS